MQIANEIGYEIGLSEHVFHTLLTNTCSKLKVEKLYWYAGYGQSQQQK